MTQATVDQAMAKKRAAGPPGPEPKAKPERKPMVVQIRGDRAYKTWVEGIAEREGFPLAMLFDRALRAWAKEHGYPEPPKR
jgi:hypothetical protein